MLPSDGDDCYKRPCEELKYIIYSTFEKLENYYLIFLLIKVQIKHNNNICMDTVALLQ